MFYTVVPVYCLCTFLIGVLCGWSIQVSVDSPSVFSFLFRFRLWCQRVIGHKMFDHVILLFIFLNCITIALERPDIQPNSMVRRTCLDPLLTGYSETERF